MRGHKYDTDPLRDPVTGHIDRHELHRRIRGWLAVLLAFAVLFGGFGFAAYKGYDAYKTYKFAKDFPGPSQGKVQVVIPQQSTSLAIGKLLVTAGVVKDASKFSDAAATRPDLWAKVQAGKYQLDTQIPASQALAQLADPKNAIRVMLSLREGQTLPQLLQAISDKTKIPLPDLQAYVTNTPPTQMGLPGYAPVGNSSANAEGFLFPDTYEVPDGVKPETMVKRAISQFNAIAAKIDLLNASQNLNFGTDAKANAAKPFATVIVASIIDREVSRPEDMPKVSRVIYNRLAKNMKLQLDSTVAYAAGRVSGVWTTDAERAKQNPYNTYFVAGLPQGPISNPGEAALNAALHPADGDWLFFQPINLDTGETVFSADQATHDQAAAQLKTWCDSSDANKKKCYG